MIYCKNEDPKEAMKQIKEMKTCILFEEAKYLLPKEKVLDLWFKEILEKLFSPGDTCEEILNSQISKWAQIQKYLNHESHPPQKFGQAKRKIKQHDGKIEEWPESISLSQLFTDCYTRIEILFSNLHK